MNITDKEVLKQLKIVKFSELDESIKDYPENERDGRSDMQVLADECSYFVSMYHEGGTCFSNDYEDALDYIRETRNGKRFPIDDPSNPQRSLNRAKMKYQQAKDCVNEYKRLVNLKKRLEQKGFYGRW